MRDLPSGLVTFCFVDVEGSTRAFRSDPQRYPAALAAHHADFLVGALASGKPIFQFTAGTSRYLAAVAAAADDVRASLTWCLAHGEGTRACALVASVFRWWNVTGRIEELCPLARQAAELPAAPSLARLMTYYALILGLEVDAARTRAEAVARTDDMLAMARHPSDDNGLALALYCQADTPWYSGELAGAARIQGAAATAATRAGSRSLAATIRRSEAEARAGDDSARLARSLGEVTSEFRSMGDPFGLAQTLTVVAGAELDSDQARLGVLHATEGLRLAREHGYAEVGWRHWTLLAWGAAAGGQPETAATLPGEARHWC
jgi:hypothetical protein